jgi:hypothetical protein
MKKNNPSIQQSLLPTTEKLTILQMSAIKGGNCDSTDDEKRRQRPGGGGVTTHSEPVPRGSWF